MSPARPRGRPRRRVAPAFVSSEVGGGLLLMMGAVAALVWANSPWRDTYTDLSDVVVGPSTLNLDLSLSTWAADGLLAIFFFVVGLELKTEIVTGSLRRPAKAAVPIVAAVAGMAVPALLYALVIVVTGSTAIRGWAVPTATDIAFALAVLALVGRGLPVALRTFLLTLAVVDDLLAVTIIALFYTADLAFGPLLLALVPLAMFGLAARRARERWWVLLPLAATTWILVHESGVHATVAGVALGFVVPAVARGGETESLTHRWEHLVRPISQGLALPLFAFFAAGVTVVDADSLGAVVTDPITLGVLAGLVLGKVAGVWGAVVLLDRFTPVELDPSLRWLDVVGVALLAGIGFTVSLLIGDLAFGPGTEQAERAKLAIILASTIAGIAAALVLRASARRQARETEDVPA